jgi:hypothetical protein
MLETLKKAISNLRSTQHSEKERIDASELPGLRPLPLNALLPPAPRSQ